MVANRLNTSLIRSVLLRAAVVAAAAAALLIALQPSPALSAAVAVLAVAATAALIVPRLSRTTGALLEGSEALLRANIDALGVLGGTVARREHGRACDNSRVVLYAVRIAEQAGLTPAQISQLIKGALVHDIGNVILPDDLLLKPDRLDDIEYEAVKTHVYHGVEILAQSGWLREAAEVVMCHHEKWDGSGYPAGLKGADIPIGARVFALADVFDALTSPRPYRGRLSFEKAMEIMLMGRGGHFDPELYDAFAAVAADMHGDLAGKPDGDIEHELLVIAFRYFQRAAEGR